jgi:hypothetical protein
MDSKYKRLKEKKMYEVYPVGTVCYLSEEQWGYPIGTKGKVVDTSDPDVYISTVGLSFWFKPDEPNKFIKVMCLNSTQCAKEEEPKPKMSITTTKEIIDGVPSRRVIKIEGVLAYKDLPIKYRSEVTKGCCYTFNNGKSFAFWKDNKPRYLTVGKTISEEYWAAVIKEIPACCERLHKINHKESK